MKKITFIFNGHASKKEGTSGGETHTIALINNLDKQKYDISVCCPQKCHSLRQIKGIKLLTYPSIPFEEKMYDILSILFFIYWYRIIISIFTIHKLKPDIIITNSHLFHDTIPTFFINNKDLNIITYLHHIITEQKRGGISFLITRFLEKVSFYVIKKKDSIVFTDSDRNKTSLIDKYGFHKEDVYVIRNGIDLNFISNVKGMEKSIYDICFCGRLNKTKGVFDLIKIVKKIKEYYPNILCVIIGEGREKDNLKKAIKNSNLENNIKLMGFLEEREKIKTIKSSKLFVLPSHEEGWGIVIGEAMACGLPVIIYKLKDIVNIWKDNVIWIKCFDLNEFSNKVIELLKNNKERKLFIQKGLKFANTLDWKDILSKELSIIMKKKK